VTVTRPTVKTLPTKLFFSFEDDELLLLGGFSSREFSLRSNLDRIFFLLFFCSWGQCDQSGVLQFDAQSAASAADYRLAKNSQVAGVK